MKRIRKLLSICLSIAICITLLPFNAVYAAESDEVPFTVTNGTESFAVTASSIDMVDLLGFDSGATYETVLPEDFSSVTVTCNAFSGDVMDLYCNCNKHMSSAEGQSLSVSNHTCSVTQAMTEAGLAENAIVVTATDWETAAILIIRVGGGSGGTEPPDKPGQTYDLTYTLKKAENHTDAGIAACTVTFKDAKGNTIIKAAEGDQVTATADTPSTNAWFEYQLKAWSTTANIQIPEGNPNSFTFTMPASAVELEATFEAIGATITWESLADNFATAPELSINGCFYGDSHAQTRTTTIKNGGQLLLGFSNDYYNHKNEWKFLGWTVTADGTDITNQIWQNAGEESGKIQNISNAAAIHVVGKFHKLAFASVNVSANDSAMGTATAVVGTGTPAATLPVVFENQIVTLTATPADRYKFDHWTVKDPDGTQITTTPDASDANKATFVMPALATSGGTFTAEACFVLDPSQASGEKTLSAALLAADGSSLGDKCTSSREGSMITLTLAPDVDTSDLASMILKLTCSDHATVKRYGEDENWPDAGKACNMTLDQEVTFVVTAENGDTATYTIKIVQQRQLSSEKAITGVELIYGGQTFASGELNEATSTWTITLDDDIDPTILGKIGTATDVFMKIGYTGASLAQSDGYDDAGFDDKWDSGKIMCGVSPGSQQTFRVTAEDGSTKDYIIAITQPSVSGEPVLSNGNATRTSDTAATVTFTSSAAGSYYYKVVTSGAGEPGDIEAGTSGTATVGTNTISLRNLAAGARDIYILVKNAAGDASNTLRVSIPAFGEDPDNPDNPDNPDEGDFTITYTGPSGGKLVPSRTRANAGDKITVTAVPDAGMQLVAGSMKFTLGVPGGESTVITDGSFIMPSADVTLSCKWEAVKTSTDGITGFVIDGVAGVVDNSTNTISVVMAYGTDVTKLIPIISGNNIASISPASGEMVNFTNPVRYTVTLTDGTVRYYTVTVYVQEGTAADKMWDKLTDFYDQTPWWEYAEHQTSTGSYPKYW